MHDPVLCQIVERLILPALLARFLREHNRPTAPDDEKASDVPEPVELHATE